MAGAERRIKELQTAFNSPERYGKGLDWTGYTVHDAANILRRYFNQLPEPIIPLEFYQRFREPLRNHQAQAVGEIDGQEPASGDFDPQAAIKTYQRLITELPPLNRQLLLYILDLLAVFASKSDLNRMTAPNLSAIFQPGLLSHPTHDMSPKEYRLSQDVLIFLIENQDHFLVGMQGTAADEKTIQEVQGGQTSQKPAPARQVPAVGRSASNSSAGAESVRRYGGVRRNASLNSRRSRQSNNTPSPVTPPPDGSYPPAKIGGVHRSNTAPSRKSGSPALATQSRFYKDRSPDRPERSVTTINQQGGSLSEAITGQRTPSSATTRPPQAERLSPHLRPVDKKPSHPDRQLKMEMPPAAIGRVSPVGTPRDRAFSSFFRQSPTSDVERKDGRKPNKLQKKRPEHSNLAAEGSQHGQSVSSHPPSPAYPSAPFSSSHRSSRSHTDGKRPEMTPDQYNRMPGAFDEAIEELPLSVLAKESTMTDQEPTEPAARKEASPQREPRAALRDNENRASGTTLKPAKSPAGSNGSRSTSGLGNSSHQDTDDDDGAEDGSRRHHRWRMSRSVKNDQSTDRRSEGLHMGSAAGAERSTSSVASHSRPRKSFTDDSTTTPSTGVPGGHPQSYEQESGGTSTEKKGPIGWFKGKLHEREERKAEKERAKSPPPAGKGVESRSSKQSLNAVAADGALFSQPRSMENVCEEPAREEDAK